MTTNNQPLSPKSVFKNITFIHIAFCATILLFGTVTFFTAENAFLNVSDANDIFLYLVPVFAIAAAVLSVTILQKNLNQVQEKPAIQDKLIHLQTSKLIQYAMIEAPAFFGIVIFLMTSNLIYLIISAVLLAYLVMLKPSASQMKEDLKLNAEQDQEFRRLMR
ncbi:hypothetical protein [Winogradskyella sp. SM1960]|uniref:hypothetical protein n=1 Tax=Winogradskyella sp. SM1960 TaxID=2865955 RepID=UPI001CD332F9|nr:hypothetical protein [Winogradskyella sp. SM1960]